MKDRASVFDRGRLPPLCGGSFLVSSLSELRHSFLLHGGLVLGVRSYSQFMFARTFIPWQLLRHVYGTEPFVQYCQSRSLAFEQRPGLAMERDDFSRWQAVLKGLPEAEQAKVELELAQVNEMAHADAVAQLLAAASERGLPSD